MSIVIEIYDYYYDSPETTDITLSNVKERSIEVSRVSYRSNDAAQ